MPDEQATVDPSQDYLRSRGYMPQADIDAGRASNTQKLEDIGNKEMEAIKATREQRNTLTNQSIAAPKFPKLQQLPNPQTINYREPFQVFQNPAVLLATLGSLMTRAPLTTAMNAGAAAMEAQKKGDDKLFEQQTQIWEEATKKAQEQNKNELEKYNGAWKNAKLSVEEKLAKLNALAAGEKDEILLAGIASGQVDRMDKILDAREKANIELGKSLETSELHRSQIDLNKARQDALTSQQSGLSDKAATDAAERYIQTGVLPTVGWGKTGAAIRTTIMNKASDIMEQRGIDPESLPQKWQKFGAQKVAIQRFESGPQGNVIRSLNVVVDHLSTLDKMASALQNNDIQQFNRLSQAWAQQTGSAVPTNFDTAKTIVGTEIIKALGVAGAGTERERHEAAEAFSRASSPEQLAGAISTVKKLLAGQVRGIKLQFKTSTGLSDDEFNSMLLPQTVEEIGNLDSGGKPSLNSWLAQAREHNPGVSDAELTDYYNKKYK